MSEVPKPPSTGLGFEVSERLLAGHVEEFLRILDEEASVPELDIFCQRAPESLRRQLRERCIDIRSIKRLLPSTSAGKTATPGASSRTRASDVRKARRPHHLPKERTMPGHDENGQMKAKVSLNPAIQLDPCSTYFMTSQWLEAKPALEARQRLLRKVHDEVVRAFGGKGIGGWHDLKDAPAEVTVWGAPIEETKKYVDRTLAQLGKAPSGELLFSTTRCPPGATCRPTEDVHWVSYEFKLMREGRPWVVHEQVDGIDVCLEVRIALEVETRAQHQPGGAHEHAGAAGRC